MCSRNSRAASFRSNSSSEMNQYSRPFASPSRRSRVVAEIASSSSGIRASSSRSIVPLPAPDVPVTTKTGVGGIPRTLLGGLPAVEEVDQFGALPFGETAHRLRLADPGLVEEAARLDAPELRQRHEDVEHLRGRDVLGRSREDALDRDPSGLQILLELSPPDADVIGSGKRLHPLMVGPDRRLGRSFRSDHGAGY